MPQKILLVGNISEKAETQFTEAGFEVYRVDADSDAISEALQEADVVCGRTSMQLSKDMIESAPNLKAIAVFSVNTSNVDIEAATEKDIPVFSAAGLSATSVAELTIGLLLSLLRKIPQQDARLKECIWQKSAIKDNAHEASGKTLGILGFGDIGRKVAEIASALGMEIIFYDPYTSDDIPEDIAKRTTRESVLRRADIITVHASTDNELIGEMEFKMIKDNAYIINMARAGTVNVEDLAEALIGGQLAGVAVDVHEIEKEFFDSPLSDPRIRNKVILTNHSGGETIEARERISRVVAQRITDYLLKRDKDKAINL